jgi:hypothetical protein
MVPFRVSYFSTSVRTSSLISFKTHHYTLRHYTSLRHYTKSTTKYALARNEGIEAVQTYQVSMCIAWRAESVSY